ncbi:MAG: D-alanyl-D-alanine carboxypeptidase [Cyanobacteria bacterium J06641_5]
MIGSLLAWLGWQAPPPVPLTSLDWAEVAAWPIPIAPDPAAPPAVRNYLQALQSAGFSPREQGVWVGSDWDEFASYQADLPLSAASLTKMATTLAALQRWGYDHRYVTSLETTGSISAGGTLEGDLIVRGGGDPLLVWEDAIAIGQALGKMGIARVAGDLIVVGPFEMNFDDEEDADPAADFGQALDAEQWSEEITTQFARMESALPPPRIEISGRVRRRATGVKGRSLLTYKSLSLAEILQQMNAYSNNVIAERLAAELGGGAAISRVARAATEAPASEVQLQNGSGLGFDNRLSARAAARLLPAIARELQGTDLTLADLFPVGELNQFGTIEERSLPRGAAVKTGSLWRASALAGAIPTEDRGWVYFAIVNQGTPIVPFRKAQDRLLAALTQNWELAPVPPQLPPVRFGDLERVQSLEPLGVAEP